MLIHLHVKNFALIDEIEADFTHGLNILTGETGAGKSILLGSINLALGGKADRIPSVRVASMHLSSCFSKSKMIFREI